MQAKIVPERTDVLTESVTMMLDRRWSRAGASLALLQPLPRPIADSAAIEIERITRLQREVEACASACEEWLPLNGQPLHIFIGDQNRWMDEQDHWMYCNHLAALACAQLTKDGRVYVTGQPGRASPIVTIGGPASTHAAALMEGLDDTKPFLPRIRPPLTGAKYGWDYMNFHQQGAEGALSYDSIKFSEPRWGIVRNDLITADCTPISQPDIYRAGDSDDERDAGFVKEGDLLITVAAGHHGHAVISLAGQHPGDTAEWAKLARDPRFHRQAKHAVGLVGDSLQILIHFSKVTPDHTHAIMGIPDDEWHIADVAPLGNIDEGLLDCFAHRSWLSPRFLTRDGLRDRVLWCRGIDFRKAVRHA